MDQPQPTARDAQFLGSIPELYDRCLGPFLFAPLAADLAGRVILPRDRPPRLLEIAAGTGRLTERLLERLPAGGALVATDLNDPMLALARTRIASADTAGAVEFRAPVDAMELPFADGEFDAVVCQLGVMFFPDKPRAAREALRVLRSGGQWIFNVMASLDENPMGRIVNDVVGKIFPVDPPTFFRVPFSFPAPEGLRALAADAGFEAVEVTDVERTAESPSAEEAAYGFVCGNPGIITIRERGVDSRVVVDALRDALVREFGDHPLRLPLRARVLSARKPAHADGGWA
ncbi:MAG TPA: methyltransferase domain-containing protein [Longimicrobium sp.]|nr:methyltransferase domain-containing protein [Longimicrobium sp.]